MYVIVAISRDKFRRAGKNRREERANRQTRSEIANERAFVAPLRSLNG